MNTISNDKSAELLGRPIIERIVECHSNTDYDMLIQRIPEFGENLDRASFEEAAQLLAPLGKATSISYMGKLNKVGHYLLLWKVVYENCDEEILWQLYLSDTEGNVKTVGMAFDR